MTNMLPQVPENNQQTWANLESYCHILENAGNELYIIIGSYGEDGTGSAGTNKTIAGGKITVPARVWKVVVVLPEGRSMASKLKQTLLILKSGNS